MNRTIVSGIAIFFLLAVGLLAAVGALTTDPARSFLGDTEADRVFGQGGSFTTSGCNQGGISASSICFARGVWVDAAGNFYVADVNNHRVLEYDTPLTTDRVADRVFGQGDSFTNGTCNQGAGFGNPTAGSLCAPTKVASDGAGNVYVVDQSNHRVVEYDSPLTTDTVADRVFGQGGSFTSATPNLGGISASSLSLPDGVAVDAAGNLYVVDQNNQRVLEYNSPLTADTVADRVFGQGGNFNTQTCNTGPPPGIPNASTLCIPNGVVVDGAGNVYVAERQNTRVVEYDTPLTTDTVADRVFGQGGSFATRTCNLGGVSASSLCLGSPGGTGITVDSGGNLYVGDNQNNRVLVYSSPLTTDTVADRVFGQGGNFSSNTCNLGGISTSGLCEPLGVAAESGGNLYIADHNNSRVLEYDAPLATPTATPTTCPGCTPGPTPSPTATATASPTPAGGAADIEAVSLTANPGNVGTSSGSSELTEIKRNNGPASLTVADTVWTCTTANLGHPVNCRFEAQPGDGCFRSGSPVPCDAPGFIDELRFQVSLGVGQPATIIRNITISCGAPGSGFGETHVARITASQTPGSGSPPDPNPDNNTLSAFIGVFCPGGTPTPTPGATGTATPTATATATVVPTPGQHDGRAKKISAASSVVLSDGPDVKNVTVQVRNEGDHAESFAVYVDVVPPGGMSNPYGCTPVGRIIDAVVALASGDQTVVQAAPMFNCADIAGALNQTYTIMAAVDAHGDDGGACGPFQIQSMACFNALADDDTEPADNRATTNAFRVK